MNAKLVDSLAQIIQSLTPEEQALLEEKVNTTKYEASVEAKSGHFQLTSTPEEWIKAFREWAESHRHNTPHLSDEAISRESIYGERG